MKTLFKSGAFCAALSLISSSAHAIEVLHVSSSADTVYAAFIEAKFPGSTWVSKPTGVTTANDTIGGDLDRVVNFTVNGSHGGTGISVRSYMESFDLIIVDIPTSSGNLVDGVLGADWSTLTKPILFHPSVAVRATGGRPGLFSGDNNVSPFTLAANESARVSSTPLSDLIFSGVTDVTNLYDALSTDTINAIATFGGGERLTTLSNGASPTPVIHHGIVFWNAGVANAVGQTLASKRAYLPLKSSDINTDLSDDGIIVLGNIIDQLLVPIAPLLLPPATIVAKSGVSSVNLTWAASSGAVSYNIKRSSTAGSGYVTISTPGSVTGTSYSDTGLVNGTTYYYVISAVNAGTAESANSTEVSATAVPVIQPSIDILYISNSNSTNYQNFGTNGQFAANTWTQKATGTGNDQIGGDLDRTATFTGTNGGTDITLKSYLESFDVIVVGVPTTSSNFIDESNGADWSGITKPILFHSAVASRSLAGRPGLFSQDNFITFLHGNPADTVLASSSALANAVLAGVTSEADLYILTQSDTISRNALSGNGETITRMTDGSASHYGIVFWAAGDSTASGLTLAANRAFLPLKGNIDDLTADGKIVLGNLINQIQLAQVTPANPYGAWAATHISAVDALAVPGFDQDADNDGIRNGLEWILGGDPLVNDVATVTPSSSGNTTSGLTLVFNRTADSVAVTTLGVDWDSDLDGFANTIVIGSTDVGPSGNDPTVDVDAPVAGKVTVNIPAANAAGGRIFARLNARLDP